MAQKQNLFYILTWSSFHLKIHSQWNYVLLKSTDTSFWNNPSKMYSKTALKNTITSFKKINLCKSDWALFGSAKERRGLSQVWNGTTPVLNYKKTKD